MTPTDREWQSLEKPSDQNPMHHRLLIKANRLVSILTFALLVTAGSLQAAALRPVRVLMWDEQQLEQKRAYGDKFLGETIAAHLSTQPGFVVKNVSITSQSQGLDEATLNDTDVVIWWSHQKNAFVTDENVERLVTRVRQGKLGFIALHSAHWARPFVRLMQERAKDDARAQIPTAERATAKFDYFNQNPLGKVPPRNAPLTPALRQEDGVWKLTLPGCIFPAYRGDGAPSHVTTLLAEHPIAAGLPLKWEVKQTEMYDEPFHVPTPDAVIFEERWDKGEHFRSGCVWQVGEGRVFYFRPGHETFPVFLQAEPLRVVQNAARWAAPKQAPTLPAAHTTRNIEGWNVLVDDRLLHGDGTPKGERALKLLTARLVAITIVVPEPALAKLRAVTIELDLDCGGLKSMQYHPDAGWLKSHGYSETLAQCVHIPTVDDFLSPFENHRMPWAVLHELSHAYHDQVLGFEDPRVLAAWKKFRDSGKYKSVLTSPGSMREHYGLTDQKEFFAEMTECYFGSNDFYPFVTGELKQAEPELFTLLQEIWGPLPGHTQAGAKGKP